MQTRSPNLVLSPRQLDTVCKSLMVGLESPGETGIFDYKGMDRLAGKF